jgi:hypothetical protein
MPDKNSITTEKYSSSKEKKEVSKAVEIAAEKFADLFLRCWLASESVKPEEKNKSDTPIDIS